MMDKLIWAMLLGAVVLFTLFMALVIWDTPYGAAARPSSPWPPAYREDTAHYLTEDGELIGGYYADP